MQTVKRDNTKAELRPTKNLASKETLTTKALLGALSEILQVIIRLFTGFIVTPMVVHGLGKELYGAWAMIQQTLGYIQLADLRATSTVKFTLAVDQHREDFHYKRQQIGASLLIIAQVIPLIIVIGAIATWFAPQLIQTDIQYAGEIRWALGIGVIGILVAEFATIPGNILRGMNLEYKAMGLEALVMAITSGLILGAVWFKTGLLGLACAIAVGPLLIGSVQYFIAYANIPWLGAEWPSQAVLRRFWKQVSWIFLASMGYVMQNTSDLLVVGMVLGPATAAVYGTTGAVLRMFIEPLYSIIGAANPGVSGLCGQREWKRIEQIRNEMHMLAFFVMVVFGASVLALNKNFMNLWLGPTYYYGDRLNLLLVVIALQNIPLRLDTMLMDGMLKFRERAISTIATSMLGFALGTFLAQDRGIEGMAIGIIIGRLFAIIIYQIIIKQGSSIELISYIRWMSRPVMIGIGLLTASYFISFDNLDLLQFISIGSLITLCMTLTMWFIGLNHKQRNGLTQRFGSQFPIISRYFTRHD